MGHWSINELDKSKTEQSITNEGIRLKQIKESYNKLDNEYEAYLEESNKKLNDMKKQLISLENSYMQGLEFIKQCNEHLILDFKNAEDN